MNDNVSKVKFSGSLFESCGTQLLVSQNQVILLTVMEVCVL